MSKLWIEIGEKRGYGYVGVQPPLTEDQEACLGDLAFLFHTDSSTDEQYSVLAVVGENTHEITEKVRLVGRRVTEALTEAGFDVDMNETVYQIEGSALFSDPKIVKGPPMTYPMQIPSRSEYLPHPPSGDIGSRVHC